MEKIIFRNLTNVKFQQLKNAISKDKLRPQLMGVFLDVKNEKIVVTNGNVLVAYDVEIIDGELKKEAIIDDADFGLIKIQGLAMTMNFDEEEITNQSEEVKINYEENGKVPTEVVNKLMGRKTSRRVLKTWNEDFVDEDNGEVVSIERNEIIVDKNTIIDRDVLDEIINVQAKSVFIHKYQ